MELEIYSQLSKNRISKVEDDIEHAIIDHGIPPYPAVLKRFMAEASKDDPDFNLLAEIIATDVALSAGLIKTANSPVFGMRQRVRSVRSAIVILGLRAAGSAVAGIILRNSFPTLPNLERFWDASGRIAMLSAWLAHKLALHDLLIEDAYTLGLFRDCGIPVILRWFPDYWEVLNEANQDAARRFIEVERSQLQTDHAKIGNLLAKNWILPEEICIAIACHHDLEILRSDNLELPVSVCKLIAITHLAEHILQKQLGLSLTQEWAKLGDACMHLLNLSEERLADLCIDAADIVNENNSR